MGTTASTCKVMFCSKPLPCVHVRACSGRLFLNDRTGTLTFQDVMEEVEELAVKINGLIRKYCENRLAHLSEASSKKL